MAPTASPGASSTSARPPSPRSRRSGRASRTSPSPGSPSALTPSALRALALRHGIRPKKALGQHFLIEPALARRIVELGDVGPSSSVLEIGAGLGSLTTALAATGAAVVAVETDRALIPALEEVLEPFPHVRVVQADALQAPWDAVLEGPGPWTVVANLPYNVAVPVVMRLLETEPRVQRLLVMVQREVGERLTAAPGTTQFGALSLKVAFRAEAEVVRKVTRTVFWPQPNVDSVLVRLVRRPHPPVEVDERTLWDVVETAFAQRRKNMRGALTRLGFPPEEAEATLEACGVARSARPEELGLDAFACIAAAWAAR